MEPKKQSPEISRSFLTFFKIIQVNPFYINRSFNANSDTILNH